MNPFPLAPASTFWPTSEDPMQGNLFTKLDEYSPPPRARNTARAPQRALPVEPEILPPRPKSLDNPLAGLGDTPVFTHDDVQQALKIFWATPHDPAAAMQAVLMFALQAAAINLDVHP